MSEEGLVTNWWNERYLYNFGGEGCGGRSIGGKMKMIAKILKNYKVGKANQNPRVKLTIEIPIPIENVQRG